MSKKMKFIARGIAAVFLMAQLGCSALSAGGDSNAGSDIPLGPQITQKEHQTGVFESVLSRIEDGYIYSGAAAVDLDSLRKKYQAEIDKGLTTAEFDQLMEQFTNEFPQGDILYITREERIEADTAANTAGYGGIGAFVNFQAGDQPHVVILGIIPGSPAEKAGLKAHDSIYAVDGDPVRKEEGSDVVLRIRGEPGTKVVLTVHTPGRDERDVEITRAQITGIGELIAEELPDADAGYILLPTVGTEALTNDIIAALETFSKNSGLKGVILDLRIAGVNSNFPLEDMLTLFLDDIQIDVYTLQDSQTFTVKGRDYFGSQEIPIAVLVGENTSGPAEIFAAAVQENKRGIVIGSNTTGSIETSNSFVLPNGGQLIVAIASFRVGEDERLGIDGLSPEVRVEANWDEIIAGEDPVIQKAIEMLEVQE